MRRDAERELEQRKKRKPTPRSRLTHELEVHKVELELQNEELTDARVHLEAALARYTEVFDFAPIGYVTLDHVGQIREINHAGARILGAERKQLVGRRFAVNVDAKSLASFDALLANAQAKTTAVSRELDLRGEAGPFPARLTTSVVRGSDPVLMIAFEDISERRAKEGALARTEAALREMNQRKDEFLAMVSHELRNPLSPIRTSVAVLRMSEPGSPPAHESIEIIDRSAAHLNRLVDDLLDITRITRGMIELRREVVDLAALVSRAVDDQRSAFAANRVEIVTKLPQELLLYADAARLLQVLSNVLGNAVKFTPRGGRVAITLEAEGSSAVIRVADNGIGIAPELIGELLRPFAQVPQALDRTRGGLGLGLAMVKSLVELHGGRVAIRSAGLGRGTEVTVTLPAQGVSSAVQPVGLVPVMSRRRVLVVEDMPDNARSLQQALQLRGHDVDVATNGFAALERLVTFKPEVVLCDIGLPDMDGFAFAMRVRADKALRNIWLVALSGYARAEDIARANAAGFDRHLAKPARLEDIDRLLAELRPRSAANPYDHNALH